MITEPTKSHGASRITGLRKALLTGLAVVLPLAATVWIIGFLAHQLWKVGDWLLIESVRLGLWISDRIVTFDWAVDRLTDEQIHQQFLSWPGAGILRILLPLSIVALIGLMAMGGLWREWFQRLEARVQKLPVLGLIYTSVKQLIEGFRGLGGNQKFKRVVYIEYPAPGCRLIAFVTGDYVDPDTGGAVTVVFLPTSPNPLTGFTLLVDADKVTECSLSLEHALKMVFTAGLVTPVKTEIVKPEPAVVEGEDKVE